MKNKMYSLLLFVLFCSCALSYHSGSIQFPANQSDYSKISKIIPQLLDSSCWHQLNIKEIKKSIEIGDNSTSFIVELSSSDTSAQFPKSIIFTKEFKFVFIFPNKSIPMEEGDTLRDTFELNYLKQKSKEIILLNQELINEPKYFIKNNNGYFGLCWPIIDKRILGYVEVDPYHIQFNGNKCIIKFR
jgi:hypothetical protein